ncbi:MAG: M48 family metallopeptidase [Stellaceae bacterium]
MAQAEVMGAAGLHRVALRGRRVAYRLVTSRSAQKLRIRVGFDGVEVVQPVNRTDQEVAAFLGENAEWVLDQLNRIDRMRKARLSERRQGEILFRGEPTPIHVEPANGNSRGNLVRLSGGEIVVLCPSGSLTPVARSLENWLRSQARAEIEKQLETITRRLQQQPRRVYVMDQRTKWGNCSAGRILSFNWRLILAPDFVLQYLVTHEAVHLAIPDHSAKFWLTVQSLCPKTERARQWLSANGHRLAVKLDSFSDKSRESPPDLDKARPPKRDTGNEAKPASEEQTTTFS